MEIASFNLGNKIKKIRELRNYTQEYMAEALKMSQTGYGKIERNETDISMSRLQQVAEVLGMQIQDIWGFDDKMMLVGNMNNNATGVQNGVIFSTDNFERERKLYEEQISNLKEENAHLRQMVNKLMG